MLYDPKKKKGEEETAEKYSDFSERYKDLVSKDDGQDTMTARTQRKYKVVDFDPNDSSSDDDKDS